MVIKQRNPITQIILSIVTCGIYGLYWAYCMAKEAVGFADPEDKGTLEIVLFILFPFIGMFLTEKKFAAACEAKGVEHKENSILYLILGLLGPLAWVAFYMFQTELNKVATE